MSYVNQFEHKVVLTLFLSLLPYAGFLYLAIFLLKTGIMSFTSESISLVVAGGSLCLGTIGRKIVEWNSNVKESIKSFSTATKESEKVQEELQYTINLEKAKNRNEVIYQIRDLLKLDQESLNNNDINEVKNNIERVKRKVETFSDLLDEKYKELDLLTVQKVLSKKFWRIRNKSSKVIDYIICGMMSGLLLMIIWIMPILFAKEMVSFGFYSLIIPFIAGDVIFSVYMLKRNKDFKKVFNKLNKELGENALTDDLKDAYKEEKEINAKIGHIIREISNIEIKLLEEKENMELFLNDSDEKKQEREKTEENIIDNQEIFEKENTFEEEKGHSLKLH